MSDAASVLNLIKEKGIQFVDLRFTDTKGKWQHTAQDICTIDEDVFVDGIMFDGSSIAGWKRNQQIRHDPDAGSVDRCC